MGTHKANCRIVAEVLRRHGVTDIVCSPGSRNAPLLLAADALPKVSTQVIIDERQAAFIALGMAQISRRPTALICTSGTALLNYAPAVAEAYYAGIPLIVVSADRPARWIDQDDSQTLRQPGALANFVKKSFDIPDFDASDEDMCLYANRLANDAMIEAMRGRRGPVHINVRLSEPLTGRPAEPLPQQRIIKCLEADDILPKERVRDMAVRFAGKKILVVAGFMAPDARLNKSVTRLASLQGVYVMHETISNLHLPRHHLAVDVILSTLTAEEKERLKPDLVITIGGALVSRYIKEYLRSVHPAEHWAVGHSHTTVDCFNALTLRIEADPGRFLSMFGKFLAKEPQTSDYTSQWNAVKNRALRSHAQYLAAAPWSDLKAAQTVFAAIPREANLQLSNGTSVRYAQLCLNPMPHGCYCNRGVSGIEGSLSTAIGAAMAYPEMTVLFTGDMSMAYDVSALSVRDIPERLKIVVLSNGGGGIFRFISSTSSLPEREHYFCAPPQLPLPQLAAAYGFEYYRASSPGELKQVLPMFFAPRLAPAILEVVTPGEIGGEVLRGYMNRENN